MEGEVHATFLQLYLPTENKKGNGKAPFNLIQVKEILHYLPQAQLICLKTISSVVHYPHVIMSLLGDFAGFNYFAIMKNASRR